MQAQPSRNRGGASQIWVLCLFMPIYLLLSLMTGMVAIAAVVTTISNQYSRVTVL